VRLSVWELGVRHLPTERLLAALDVRCEADISLDLAEIFEEHGDELPLFTDEDSAEVASRIIVDAVAEYGPSVCASVRGRRSDGAVRQRGRPVNA
jgi:hypothetical protein